MSEHDSFRSFAILGVLLAAGMLTSGYFIGSGVTHFRLHRPYVTVKGLAEKEVKADLAVWELRFSASGNDVQDVQGKAEADQQRVLAFLRNQGFKAEEVETRAFSVTDLFAREYGDRPKDVRYVVRTSVLVRTPQVDLIDKVSRMTGPLVKAGVLFAEDSGPHYLFTQLAEIKPSMIAEATQQARRSAEQFAKDSGARVGTIQRASQGVIDIFARDRVQEAGGYSGSEEASIFKKIRVVTTLEYLLEG